MTGQTTGQTMLNILQALNAVGRNLRALENDAAWPSTERQECEAIRRPQGEHSDPTGDLATNDSFEKKQIRYASRALYDILDRVQRLERKLR